MLLFCNESLTRGGADIINKSISHEKNRRPLCIFTIYCSLELIRFDYKKMIFKPLNLMKIHKECFSCL